MKFPPRVVLPLAALALVSPLPLLAAGNDAPSKSAASRAPTSDNADDSSPDLQSLYDVGKQLFDDYAPDEVKRDYEFPSQAQWDEFAGRLQQALQGGSLEQLVAYEPEARRTLAAFRAIPEYSDYVDWLTERLDLIETARLAVEAKRAAASAQVAPSPNPATPNVATPTPNPNAHDESIPYYDVWYSRLKDRPPPARADDLLPLLKVIFSAEGLPPELAWLAEVESSLNPSARSPAGARGLFQLMPSTAKSLGLHLLPFDERTQPGKNARAAAILLHKLHDRFDSWPLALAAYNAGEGRVSSVLKKNGTQTFREVIDALPAETQMYVPKVMATVAVREKADPVKVLGPAMPAVAPTPGARVSLSE